VTIREWCVLSSTESDAKQNGRVAGSESCWCRILAFDHLHFHILNSCPILVLITIANNRIRLE
jgi:hypothetical protein